MAGKKEEIVVDVRSAVKFEQELQAHIDHGVVLVDVYSAEWGPCKALAETFRALNNDPGAKLRILSAECHGILESLKNGDERNHLRPKNMEAIRETLPEAWQSLFEERAGHAKPYFVIYKEGKRCCAIDGVNTPVIRSTVKDLRTVRQPPDNFLTGALLTAWKQHVHNDESEVTFDKFSKALHQLCNVTEALSGEERTALLEALGAKDSKIVTAAAFQQWVGEEGTVQTAFTATLPDYHVRSAKAAAEREVEEKAREERDAAEVKKAEAKKVEEAAQAEEKKEQATADNKSELERWAKAAHMTVSEAKDTPALRTSRKALGVETNEKATFTAALTFLDADSGAEAAQKLAEALAGAPTLSKYLLTKGATVATVHNIRRAVEKRFAKADVLAAGKMASLCLTSTDEEMKTYFNVNGQDVLKATLNGTAAAEFPAVALAAITTGVSDAAESQETLYFTAPASQVTGLESAEVGATVIVPPLAPFSTRGTKKVNEGDLTVVLKGTSRAIFTAAATVRPASAVALTAWYGSYEVVAKEDARVELVFRGTAFDDTLDGLGSAVRQAQSEEDDANTAISQLQRAIAEQGALAGETQEVFDEAVVKVNAEGENAGEAEPEGENEEEEKKSSAAKEESAVAADAGNAEETAEAPAAEEEL